MAKNNSFLLWLGSCPLALIFMSAFLILSYFYFDLPIAIYLRQFHGTHYYILFNWLTYLGATYTQIIFLVICFLISLKSPPQSKLRSFVKYLLIAIIINVISYNFFKILLGRARPYQFFQTGQYGFYFLQFQSCMWSFPSGHATMISGTMTALSQFWPRYQWIYLGLIILICVSRLVLQMHYLSDVMAGVILGTATTTWVLQKNPAIFKPKPM